ncbi:hypothetical protein PPL_06406 [Heterostelium album PN500]|uniref:Uncharacterized protein n=1 Tax=Heterostelium pallidum (strain ATCC 26659 / Pp 5 / PN500) TaxID=670386 RepID=D3BD26_HETP5|nr:hypothetical protein PPL_06406 [Heterostelium album PN500]EFA80818.1 hypothetical protein PPL_06406 [Heterostelium album PN500]|eukprot:XP_020432937.1 hypothetical protein PPL_06406 [Heterostelium album PN500]
MLYKNLNISFGKFNQSSINPMNNEIYSHGTGISINQGTNTLEASYRKFSSKVGKFG